MYNYTVVQISERKRRRRANVTFSRLLRKKNEILNLLQLQISLKCVKNECVVFTRSSAEGKKEKKISMSSRSAFFASDELSSSSYMQLL